jgi:hypothetical protein
MQTINGKVSGGRVEETCSVVYAFCPFEEPHMALEKQGGNDDKK